MKQPLRTSLSAFSPTFSLICGTAVPFNGIRVAARDVFPGREGALA